MERELWRRVEELFDAALAQPAEERVRYVHQNCSENEWLRGEVESLLENAADNDSFLEHSPLSRVRMTVGDKLGNFKVLGILGSGATGDVYRARDERLNRDVAIKVLRSFSNRSEKLARFEREARAASALNHPNVVCVYDIGREGDTPWIAAELVQGQSLRQALLKGPLPLRRAIDIARQIADGLAAAHAANLVHRDLKPENVMLTPEGRVKISRLRSRETPVYVRVPTDALRGYHGAGDYTWDARLYVTRAAQWAPH